MKKTVQCVMVILCIMCALGFSGCKSDANNLVGIYDALSLRAFLEGSETKGIVINDFICPPYFFFGNTIDKTIDLDGKAICCLGPLRIVDDSESGKYKSVTFCDSTKGKAYIQQDTSCDQLFEVCNGRTLSILDGINVGVSHIAKSKYAVFRVQKGGILDVIDANVSLNVWSGAEYPDIFYIFRLVSDENNGNDTSKKAKVNKICGTYYAGTNTCKLCFISLATGSPSIGEINAKVDMMSYAGKEDVAIIEMSKGSTISSIKGGPYTVTGGCTNAYGITTGRSIVVSGTTLQTGGTITAIGEPSAKVKISVSGGSAKNNNYIEALQDSAYPNASFTPSLSATP